MSAAPLTGLALAMAAILACGSTVDTEGRSPKRSSRTLAVLERSGGIAGATESIRVRRDGTATVAAVRGKVPFRVPRRQRELLACNLRDTPWTDVTSQSQPPGPDGFTYVIRHRRHVVRVVDTTKLPTPLRAAIARLSTLIDQAPGPVRVPPLPGDEDCA